MFSIAMAKIMQKGIVFRIKDVAIQFILSTIRHQIDLSLQLRCIFQIHRVC